SSKLATPVAANSSADGDLLNFALNLEYLEAEFYLRAVYGTGLSAEDTSGLGVEGTVITKAGSTMVPFATDAIRQYATELPADELAPARFLRRAIPTAVYSPVARPTIDLRDSFTAAATAAGLISSGSSSPPGFPPSPRPADFFVPTNDCLGWVP